MKVGIEGAPSCVTCGGKGYVVRVVGAFPEECATCKDARKRWAQRLEADRRNDRKIRKMGHT
jgi:hypothetical protein